MVDRLTLGQAASSPEALLVIFYGVVVVPVKMAEALLARAGTHHEWEEFSRLRLSEGGDLRTYYPLSDAARPEYEAWLKARQS